MILPKTLQMIADYCGEECMWLVWKHYAGVHLSIPSQFKPTDNDLVENFGVHHALALTKAFAGETLHIPKFDYVKKAEMVARNQQIFQQRQAGASLARIARYHNLTERQVINILNSFKTEIPQEDLFK
jgi:hypothetical protein